jgi:pantetheine-phosphate adenylyltransferase
MTGMNAKLDPDIETVFLMADARYQSIASRLVKEIARLGGNIDTFVPDHVAKRLRDKS